MNDWGTKYWLSDSVTVATPGQVSLVATEWDYSNWVRHIVDNNAEIINSTQGFMPADVDGDGIMDVIAHSGDSVVWYKHDGNYFFTKKKIGPAHQSGWSPCTYPCDLDKDGDIDVLIATNEIGIGWYENQGLPNWGWHSLDNSVGYHRVSSVDVELDGDIDIIAVDDDPSLTKGDGDIYLFRDTTGNQEFRKELIADLRPNVGWRVYPADFNGNKFPDLYSWAWDYGYIFLNDSNGVFSLSWTSHIDEWDGTWATDIDGDGDIDIVAAEQQNIRGYYALLNNGTGTNFDTLLLTGTTGRVEYTDGAISCDVDLDGLSDIVGTLYRVGWFQQDPANPLTFTLYDIDDIGISHWVYAASLCNKCVPSIDILVTQGGAHIVFENQMLLAFSGIGELTSSIFDILDSCEISYFGYKACVPYDTSLYFYWRVGLDSTEIVNAGWIGPCRATVGINVIDSFEVSEDARMFQYKVEFRGGADIAVLYEVWLSYECKPTIVEEMFVENKHPCFLQFMNGKLILYLPYEDEVDLRIYDLSGRLVSKIYKGYLPIGKHNFKVHIQQGIYFAKVCFKKGTKSLKFIKF